MSERPPSPRVRGECIDGPRPCAVVTCKYHLAALLPQRGQTLRRAPSGEDLAETCALDVADRVAARGAMLEPIDLARILRCSRTWAGMLIGEAERALRSSGRLDEWRPLPERRPPRKLDKRRARSIRTMKAATAARRKTG